MRTYLNQALLLSILVCATITVKAQKEHKNLSAYNGEKEITAGKSITLLPGFHATGNVHIYIQTLLNTCDLIVSTPSGNQNYILTKTFKEPGLNPNLTGYNTCQVSQSIQYLDGLGRLVQSINIQASPAGQDIVHPITYDAFGREDKKYLPYAISTNGGAYRPDALSAQSQFYNTEPNISKMSSPYSQIIFENSPLNRVLEQGAPGDAWQPVVNSQNGHTIKTDLNTNTENDVKLWTINSGDNGATASYFLPAKLYKTIIKDENWKPGDGKAGTTEEFKDFEGRTLLKRIWESDAISLNTYYVYDDFENLRYVLPPAVNENAQNLNSFTENDDAFKNYIYGYHYDGRKRLIKKKIPGKDWEFLIYNTLNQLVLTQDAIQKQKNEWLFNKYDVFGRVAITGLYKEAIEPKDLQTKVNGQATLWESRIKTGDIGYDNKSFPQAIAYYHSINYYDDYSFPNNTFGLPDINLNQVDSERTKGLLTASKITTLGTGEMLLTVNYYDDEGRVLQSKSENHLKGSDVVNNTYNFAGELTASKRIHTANNQTTTIANRYLYDHAGRKLSTFQSINGKDEVMLSKLEYNETGQVMQKNIHSLDKGASFLQNTQYAYNERGWLKSSISDQFSIQLKYNDGTIPQYNGNISNQLWGTASNLTNTFNYNYDNLNRLTEATSPGLGESIRYDMMGNIQSLKRDGFGTNNYAAYTGNKLTTISGFTNSNYSYDENGNLTKDSQKGINLSYNYLNLPIQITGTQNISYVYNSAGQKLKKIAATGTINYVSGIQYKPDGTIDFIQTEEGIARNNGSGAFSYEYNLTDHLGNVRYSFHRNPITEKLDRLQSDNYYAFGLRKSSGSPVSENNKYLYNGKELQDELGQYDYGARFYDPVIGRWNVVDPLAEEGRKWSPYTFVYNNPLRFVDPDGMKGDDWVKYELDGKSYVKWDDKVTDQKSATARYGGSALYAGKDGMATTASGYRISLNSDKSISYNAPQIDAGPEGPSISQAVRGVMPTLNMAEGIATVSAMAASGSIGLTESAGNFLINGVGRRATFMVGSRLAEARALGIAGEAAVGVSGIKESISVAGRTRIPDILTKTTLEEVKNVRYQSLTRQLRDFYQYSQENNLRMILHTRSGTTISKPLQKLIDQRTIIHEFIPGL